MNQRKPSRQTLLIGFVLLFALLGVAVVLLDWKNIRTVFAEADWHMIPVALVFTALSYACMSYGFAVVNRAVGIHMPRRELFIIGYVSTVINHVLSAGGAAGYSLRFAAIRKHGYAINDIVTASMLHFYFTSLGMLALLPVGIAYILFTHRLSRGMTTGIGVIALLMIALLFLATMLIFWRPLRLRILRVTNTVVLRLAKRDVALTLDDFDANVTRGIAAFRRHRLQLVWLLLLVALDWGFSILALGACFDAIGQPLKLGVLISGFSIGMTAGVLSMVPGGLGVQEGSMAGVYALLGVPVHQAILAAILFRVLYYFAPYLFSLSLYHRLLRKVEQPAPAEST